MAVVALSLEAAQDLERSRDWWDARENGLGERFVRDFQTAFDRLAQQPEMGRPVHRHRCRRLLIRRFHHGVYYRFSEGAVLVIGVFDLRRDPQEIKRLLTDRPAPAP